MSGIDRKYKTKDGVNKHHYGHQSIVTAWAKPDGKPHNLPDDATEVEKSAWCEAMSVWALKGSLDNCDLDKLKMRDITLTRERIQTSLKYSRLRF
jgi:hypothetical protein